jgi:hypothetical protein
MKTRAVLCPKCQKRMTRKYGYKKRFWLCDQDGYRAVYVCKECGEKLAIVTMEEAGYDKFIKQLSERVQDAEEQVFLLRRKLRAYREKLNTSRVDSEIDHMEKQLKRLRERLKEL